MFSSMQHMSWKCTYAEVLTHVAAVANILAQSENVGCLQFVNTVDGQTCGVLHALCWAPCNTRRCIQGNTHLESVTEVQNDMVGT